MAAAPANYGNSGVKPMGYENLANDIIYIKEMKSFCRRKDLK